MTLTGKEIAKRSLARAEEIKNRARLRKKRMNAAVAAAGLCACTLVFTLTRSFYTPIANGPTEDGVTINHNQIPLAIALFTGDPIFVIPDLSGAAVSGEGYELDMPLVNPEENACYLVFEIILADTGESLYKSYMIAPNMRIERVALSGNLEKGANKAILLIRAYDLDDFTEIGAERAEFELFY